MRLPFVSAGAIPADTRRHTIATAGFWIFDNNAVALETPTAAIKVTRTQEVAQYGELFARLQREAVYGHEARKLAAGVPAGLRSGEGAGFPRRGRYVRQRALRALRAREIRAGWKASMAPAPLPGCSFQPLISATSFSRRESCGGTSI